MISTQSVNTGNFVSAQNPSPKVESKDQFTPTFSSLLNKPEKPALSADTAKLLMYRSMTTGVPNRELEQYGGYAAVKEVFEANGGQYDILTIPDDLRRQLAEKVSYSGVGNMFAARIENLPIAASALQVMSDAGVDTAVIEQLSSSGNERTARFELTSMQPQGGELSLLSSVENSQIQSDDAVKLRSSHNAMIDRPEKPALSADTAKLLMYRSMTTGVPNRELEQYGGYAAVKEVFEANGGQYDILTIPDDLRRQLAEKVSYSGVGNMFAARIENLPIAASALQVMSDAGVDTAVIEQLSSSGNERTARFELTSMQTQGTELSIMSAVENTQAKVGKAVVKDQNTMSTELDQAIDQATASAVQYVDSASYLGRLFKA